MECEEVAALVSGETEHCRELPPFLCFMFVSKDGRLERGFDGGVDVEADESYVTVFPWRGQGAWWRWGKDGDTVARDGCWLSGDVNDMNFYVVLTDDAKC
ncbi:hypothetical protein L3X38_014352 [Prunus dulcis]|uniref:Uncharacterized protein n=1 Tax=Prunus dulcis TaxID=3755 RepID=A0AAD4WN03_PRUDU|nr:hypothetical protein L3X38_014352 [Prunus dulcis]